MTAVIFGLFHLMYMLATAAIGISGLVLFFYAIRQEQADDALYGSAAMILTAGVLVTVWLHG